MKTKALGLSLLIIFQSMVCAGPEATFLRRVVNAFGHVPKGPRGTSKNPILVERKTYWQGKQGARIKHFAQCIGLMYLGSIAMSTYAYVSSEKFVEMRRKNEYLVNHLQQEKKFAHDYVAGLKGDDGSDYWLPIKFRTAREEILNLNKVDDFVFMRFLKNECASYGDTESRLLEELVEKDLQLIPGSITAYQELWFQKRLADIVEEVISNEPKA